MNRLAAIIFVFGSLSATAAAEDLSKYRDFQFGEDLATVAKQAGMNPSEAKLLHSRPAITGTRRQIEGLTADDLVDTISGTYGTSTKPASPAAALVPSYGEQEKVLAQWQDSQYRFSLAQSSYGPDFKLVSIVKRP